MAECEMHDEARQYRLVILVESEQAEVEEQLDRIKVYVTSDAASSGVRFADEHQGKRPILEVTGTLKQIDAAHDKISECLVGMNIPFVRLIDEAGEEIRARAYPIVARIELRLRRFIDEAGISILGSERWRDYLEVLLGKEIAAVQKKLTDANLHCSQLECLCLDSLYRIIDGKVSEWPPEHPAKMGELCDLMSQSDSYSDFSRAVQAKVHPVSLWHDVFSRFFFAPSDWASMKEKLDFVLAMRNAVMHHRPIRRAKLEILEAHAADIHQWLDGAQIALDGNNREKAEAALLRVEESVERETRLNAERFVSPWEGTMYYQLSPEVMEQVMQISAAMDGVRQATAAPLEWCSRVVASNQDTISSIAAICERALRGRTHGKPDNPQEERSAR